MKTERYIVYIPDRDEYFMEWDNLLKRTRVLEQAQKFEHYMSVSFLACDAKYKFGTVQIRKISLDEEGKIVDNELYEVVSANRGGRR